MEEEEHNTWQSDIQELKNGWRVWLEFRSDGEKTDILFVSGGRLGFSKKLIQTIHHET